MKNIVQFLIESTSETAKRAMLKALEKGKHEQAKRFVDYHEYFKGKEKEEAKAIRDRFKQMVKNIKNELDVRDLGSSYSDLKDVFNSDTFKDTMKKEFKLSVGVGSGYDIALYDKIYLSTIIEWLEDEGKSEEDFSNIFWGDDDQNKQALKKLLKKHDKGLLAEYNPDFSVVGSEDGFAIIRYNLRSVKDPAKTVLLDLLSDLHYSFDLEY